MNLYRDNQIVLDDELYFYAKILTKRFTPEGAILTIDEFVRGTLRNLWQQYPELREAWDKLIEAKQRNRKEYEQIERACLK